MTDFANKVDALFALRDTAETENKTLFPLLFDKKSQNTLPLSEFREKFGPIFDDPRFKENSAAINKAEKALVEAYTQTTDPEIMSRIEPLIQNNLNSLMAGCSIFDSYVDDSKRKMLAPAERKAEVHNALYLLSCAEGPGMSYHCNFPEFFDSRHIALKRTQEEAGKGALNVQGEAILRYLDRAEGPSIAQVICQKSVSNVECLAFGVISARPSAIDVLHRPSRGTVHKTQFDGMNLC